MFFQKIYFLKKALTQQWIKPEELKKLQEKKLRALIKHAYRNVPFYRTLYKKFKIRPDDIKTLADLNKLPIIRKEDIVKNYNFLIAKNYRYLYRLGKVVFRTTTGTSGTPMKMIFDEVGWNYLEAIYLRSFLSLGYNIRKPLAYYWYQPFKKEIYNFFGFMKKNLIPCQLTEDEQLKLLLNLNPKFIYYFPSSLYSIAKKMIHEDIKIEPEFIVTQGEILSKKMRTVIERAFNAPVFDFYATTETGITAWECNAREGYHLNTDNVIVSFVDDNGEEVSEGERGYITLTSLTNYIFTLIRYRIGDIGIPASGKCSCGRVLPLMKSIEGREEDFIKVKNKTYTPKEIIDSVADIPEIYKFRFVLKNNSKIEILVVPFKNLSSKSVRVIKRKIKSLFNRQTSVNVIITEEIPKEKSGKRPMIVVKHE